jgi:hypothetical protein
VQPCYKWWEVPYYWAGLKAYDLVAGTQGLTLSRYATPGESLRQFPTLAACGPGGATLKGTVRIYLRDPCLALCLAACCPQEASRAGLCVGHSVPHHSPAPGRNVP